jgi:hypothetical protein
VNTDSCTNACLNPRCGDGFIQGSEQCDDGNTVNTDSCTNYCLNAICGDGYVQEAEECDDGNLDNTDDCTTLCKNAIYTFEGGFGSPINNGVVNIATAGKTIPVKWHLSDANGDVSDLSSFVGLQSYVVNCEVFTGDPTEAVEEYYAGMSGLQYLGFGNWQYNWKTPKSYAGTCRNMYIVFKNGQYSPTVSFKFI